MIKQLVKEKLAGRTQRWLGAQAGMTDVALSESINGWRKFKQEEFDKVREILEISDEELENIELDKIIYNPKTQQPNV